MATEEQELQSLDKWLASYRMFTEQVTCHPKNVTIYFPVEEPNAMHEFRKLRNVVNEIFGGSTVYDAEGSWCPSKPCGSHNVVTERVKVIEAWHGCTTAKDRDKLASALKAAAIRTKQSTVGVSGTNTFYIIPPGLLQTRW